MFGSMFATTMLAIECQSVIAMRLWKIAGGGWDAHEEAVNMVGEKIGASIETMGTIMGGGSSAQVVGRYREQVAANTVRLSKRN